MTRSALSPPVLTALPAAGIPLGDILDDSGYAHRDAAAWAIPLRAAGAALVQDLHPLFVDGTSGRHAGMVDALAVGWPVELTRLFRRETRGAVGWIRRAGHRLDPVAAVGPGR
jgi:hypothetical protein